MLELKLKPEAERDLVKIFEYTTKRWGIEQAEQYQNDLFEGMLKFTEQEELGKEHPNTNFLYRKLHVNRHLLFYRVEVQNCIIIRVLHDRMDLTKQLGE